MKKLICLILIIAMLAGLTACGEQVTMQGKYIYANAKGINTKTVTLKLSGTLPEGAEMVLILPYSIVETAAESEETTTDGAVETGSIESEENIITTNTEILSAALKSTKENYAEYQFKGIAEGSGTGQIYFLKNDVIQSRIYFTVTVDEKLKITAFSLNLNEKPDYSVVDLGDGTTTNVSAMDDSDHMQYYFDGEAGDWTIKSYESSIITVNGPFDSNDKAVVDIYAAGEGETNLVMLNTDEGKKVTLCLAVTKQTSDTGEENLILTAEEAFSEDYEEIVTRDEQLEENTTTVTETKKDENGDEYIVESKKDIISGFSVPSDAKVTEMNNIAYGNGDANAEPDTIFCTLQFKNTQMYYTATKAESLASYLKEMKNDESIVIQSEDTFAVGNINVTYVRSDFGTALWEDNDALHILVMLTENESSDKTLVEEFLNSK